MSFRRSGRAVIAGQIEYAPRGVVGVQRASDARIASGAASRL